MEKDGLTIVYTGKGKGKTTAALGIALRATGYKKKICMIQFIKGSWHYGEMDSSKRLEPEFEMVAIGKGFVGIIDDKSPKIDHQEVAKVIANVPNATFRPAPHKKNERLEGKAAEYGQNFDTILGETSV